MVDIESCEVGHPSGGPKPAHERISQHCLHSYRTPRWNVLRRLVKLKTRNKLLNAGDAIPITFPGALGSEPSESSVPLIIDDTRSPAATLSWITSLSRDESVLGHSFQLPRSECSAMLRDILIFDRKELHIHLYMSSAVPLIFHLAIRAALSSVSNMVRILTFWATLRRHARSHHRQIQS